MQEDERDSAAFRPGYIYSTTSYNPCFTLLAFLNIRNKVNVTDGKGTVMATALFLQKRNGM